MNLHNFKKYLQVRKRGKTLMWRLLMLSRNPPSTASGILLTERTPCTDWCGWWSCLAQWDISQSSSLLHTRKTFQGWISSKHWSSETGTRTPARAPLTGWAWGSWTSPPSRSVQTGRRTSSQCRPSTICNTQANYTADEVDMCLSTELWRRLNDCCHISF